MRNILLMIAMLALIFSVGCEDEDLYPYTGAAGVEISSDGMTELDSQVTFDITATNAKCTELTVTMGTTALGTVTLTSGAGTYTVTAADLGISAIDDDAELTFTANTEKNPIYTYTVTVEDPASFDVPDLYLNDIEDYVYFDVEPVAATVSAVSVETKVGKNGTYAAVAGTFTASDSILVVGSDYSVGDTVYFKVKSEAGTLTSESVITMPVKLYTYTDKATFKLDTTANRAIDLIEMAEIEDLTTAGDTADIEFAYNNISGGYTLGFVSNNNAEFVAATLEDYRIADVLATEAIDFTGAVNTFVDVAVDDVYVFRTNRSGGDYSYGMIKITAVEKPQGVLNDSYIEFETKYIAPAE